MANTDPFLGTWKLNAAKSKFSPAFYALMKQAPPKEQTVVIRELGTDELEVTMTGTQTDGKPIATKSTSPRQGGALKIQQGNFPEGMTIVSTRIDPNTSYLTFMLNGKQVFVAESVVSKNGKTFQNTAKGTDPQGKPVESTGVYDKQ
jgi:hypothetical protein